MGRRLFWRFFLLSWLTMLASGASVAGLLFLWLGEVPVPRTVIHIQDDGKASIEDDHRLHPVPWPLVGMLLASVALSAILAVSLSKPVRTLGRALDSVAAGRLDTRVAPALAGHSTEMAELGRGFDRMAEELQVLVTSQRRLLHDVSHELRSPLARLHAAIGLARQDRTKVASTLDRIEREAERLEHLVGELLTLSALDTRRPNEPLEPIDLVDLVASICADADFEAAARGASVSFEGDDEAWTSAYAEALHRAYENVVRNAVKHTRPGTVVEVAARVETQPPALRVTTADRGPGVAEDELETIFEPFSRAGPAIPATGSGLGLTIARRAVEIHGGHIRARPRDGGGLAVEIVVPLTPAAPS